MNQLRERAKQQGVLRSLYKVLDCELEAMEETKKGEIDSFLQLMHDTSKLQTYQINTGLTRDICERILTEVKHDRDICNKLFMLYPEQNAICGDRDLKTLYCVDSHVAKIWTGTDGQKSVDLIVLTTGVKETLLGDCKFGLKSDNPWLIRNKEQFKEEFFEKFTSVWSCIQANENLTTCSEMLLIVTSALAPLLKNRIEDFKLDPNYEGIPYDKIKICSVDDIYSLCQELLPSFHN